MNNLKPILSQVTESGDMLGKRTEVTSPPTMLIKEQIIPSKAHIFTAKDVTPLQLNPDTMKHDTKEQRDIPHHRHHTAKYPAPGTPKQSPLEIRSPPKSDPTDQHTLERPTEPVKISHEETTARLRNFIKKRTVTEAFHSANDKSAHPFQPWMPTVSNLRKATSEPNLKAKSRLRAKLTERPAAFNKSGMSSYSPRKESRLVHGMSRDRIPSTSEEIKEYSPPFKFPKLDSNFFKSLPNMKNIAGNVIPMDTDKGKLISPEDGSIRAHLLRNDVCLDTNFGSSFTTYYPSLAKLINSDSMDRQKDAWRNQEVMKNLRLSDPNLLSPFARPSSRLPPFTNGSLLSAPPERIDLSSPKNILEYAQAQLIQMQQLSQEQDELKDQQKHLLQQQERILKEQDALRQREVVIRKMFYDVSANMAVADHIVSSMVNQPHANQPMSLSTPDFYTSTKHAELLLKKHQEQQIAQAEQLLLLQRSASNIKLNSAFGHYNASRIASQSAPNVQSLAAAEIAPDVGPIRRTGIIYDSIMLKHVCTCANPVVHKEIPGRLSSIWARLTETGVANRCTRIKSRKATNEELELIHTREHVCRYGALQPRNKDKMSPDDTDDLIKLKCGGIGKDDRTIWNEFYSAHASRTSAGSVLELATKVAIGELTNAFALVRPPGHLAERNEAREGCFFNNVAIAAKYLTSHKLSNRVLIVDWDLEHGNGLQQAFYNDPNVLVINIHRYDKGHYFPRTGHVTCEGVGEGKGFNINIPFSGSDQAEFGDPEYLAAFRCIIKPVAEQFCPDIVLIAAGFNAMSGHDSYNVTAECFAFMTQELGRLADGRIMVALEGGYNLVSLSQACEMCLRSLLGEQITHLPARSLKCAPNTFAVKAIEETITVHRKYWQFAHYLNNISLSVYDAVKRDQEEVDTITALASLSMQHPNNTNYSLNGLCNGKLIQNRS